MATAHAADPRDGWVPIKETFLAPRAASAQATAGAAEPRPETSTSGADAAAGQEKEGKKQRKGRNKRKRKDVGLGGACSSICFAVAQGRDCPYGDKCRHSHDIETLLRTKPADIGPVCPLFELYGACPYGYNCRFAGHHMAKPGEGGNKPPRLIVRDGATKPPEMNAMPAGITRALRKKEYEFRRFDAARAVALAQPATLKRQQLEREKRQLMEREAAAAARARAAAQLAASPPDAPPDAPAADAALATAPAADLPTDAAQAAAPATVSTGAALTDAAAPAAAPADAAPPNAAPAAASADASATAAPADARAASSAPDATPECDARPARLPLRERRRIDFHHKIYVAPLTTVGNLPYRRVLKRFGADVTIGEMALARNLLQGQASEWALLRRHPSEDMFGVQIAGGRTDEMIKVAEMLDRETGVDFVDINMGCPIDCVTRFGAGSALMTRATRMREIATGMMCAMETPLTLKMRTGWETNKPSAHKLILQLRDCERMAGKPIHAVAIHGRSRAARYTSVADWDYVAGAYTAQLEAVRGERYREDDDSEAEPRPEGAGGAPRTPGADGEHVKRSTGMEEEAEAGAAGGLGGERFEGAEGPIPIIGNGDVLAYTDWNRHVADPRITTCMIARGALIKPWVCTEIKEQRHWDISAAERLEMLRDFARFGLEHWGSDDKGVANTRRFLLEWLSFLHRYVPVGLLERLPQHINDRPPRYVGRNDLETLLASNSVDDWVRTTEMLLGPVPDGFRFLPKHRANSYNNTAPEVPPPASGGSLPSHIPLFGPVVNTWDQ